MVLDREIPLRAPLDDPSDADADELSRSCPPISCSFAVHARQPEDWLLRTQLPPLILFFAILGGLGAYGVLGVFVGPLLLALVITGVTLYREMSAERKPIIPP